VRPRYRALVLVAAFGGLRWGELVGLRRKRVDLERGTVTVAEQFLEVNGAFSVGPPKSAAGRRTVTPPAVVVEALADQLRRYTAKSPEAFVFLSSQGKHLRRSNVNRRVWRPVVKAAGVEGLRVHDLRHTAGTLATAAGGSLREVMDRLGHSTTVAAVRYQHVMADRDAAIARELNRLIEGAWAPLWHGDGTRSRERIPADGTGRAWYPAWPAGLGWSPRRNRTGDPILTMEPPGTAVRTAVSPGRARPSGTKLSAL